MYEGKHIRLKYTSVNPESPKTNNKWLCEKLSKCLDRTEHQQQQQDQQP